MSTQNLSVWEKSGSLAEMFWQNGKGNFPIYDMHGHMGTHNAIYMKRCEPAEMAKHLQRAGVKRLVFAHHETLWGSRRNVQDYQVCKEYPDSFRMYVSINPHFPDHIKEDLAQFDSFQPYAVGLKILADYHQVPVTDPRYQYAMEFANERKLPVLFHTWGSSPYNGTKPLLALIEKYPDAKYFLGHSLYGDWEGAAQCVRANENVYLELTAIPGSYGIVEMLCSKVGSTRLLFGTDQPWFDEHQAIGGIVSADISEEDMHNILYRNAQRILGKDF